jgi:cytochrome c oxidase assembly protein subunit 15
MFEGSFIDKAIHDKITIHFIHRTLAYVIAVLIFIWWLASRNTSSSSAFNRLKNLALFFVVTQVTLGILTVLTSTKTGDGNFGFFEWSAQLHQLTGMLLLLTMVAVLYILTNRRSSS